MIPGINPFVEKYTYGFIPFKKGCLAEESSQMLSVRTGVGNEYPDFPPIFAFAHNVLLFA